MNSRAVLLNDSTLELVEHYHDDPHLGGELNVERVTLMTREVVLGFAPRHSEGFATRAVDNDDALFVWGASRTSLDAQVLMFPSLSHT
ncbi:hypothetical protein C3F42_13840 [Pseudomonas sp. PONIH3]|uniref:Uncharacterized protein n=1 Tax=Pseudomonas soli TaxID=1306993 RepID=A0A1H9SCR7_9PSED|nr:hypothetical protein C3F42_13840 [Pseudomonas sp. PONIH3]SER82810.1 hypothetical protein SAMN05216230_1131 [Pseudomonas soli]